MTVASGAGQTPPGRSRRGLALIAIVIVAVAGIGAYQGFRGAEPAPTGPPAPTTASASLPSAPLPWPSGDTEIHYDAVFAGDATGKTDVTDELKAFLQAHDGERVALAVDAVYKVTQIEFTAHDLILDFRGAKILGTKRGVMGIFRLLANRDVVVNDANVTGTGYAWEGGDSNPDQWEHGIDIEGGANITINNPTTRDTRGDGIYIGYETGQTQPSTGVVINDPNIERASRNGISPVAGEVTIRGGRISHTGLFGVDFEPNNDIGAESIRGIVDGVDIRNFGDLPAASGSCTCYAVAAAGYSTATKPSMTVQNLTGDRLRVTIRDTTDVVFQNNRSDEQTTADFQRCRNVTFTGNVRITRS